MLEEQEELKAEEQSNGFEFPDSGSLGDEGLDGEDFNEDEIEIVACVSPQNWGYQANLSYT